MSFRTFVTHAEGTKPLFFQELDSGLVDALYKVNIKQKQNFDSHGPTNNLRMFGGWLWF